MGSIVNINSLAEWKALLASADVVIADFYADWCGPCKVIAPHFEQLAKRLSNAKRVPSKEIELTAVFCKVHVDNVQDVAKECRVQAMPTFLAYRSGELHDVLQGANPAQLTAFAESAVDPEPADPTDAAKKWMEGQPQSMFNLSNLLPILVMLFFWYINRK